ncbi:MAG: AraC family transcriptional regulator [Halioglobus sp.]
MSGSGFASNPAVKQYLKMAEVHGVDQLACLKQAGIDSILLEDNSGRVPIAALEQLLGLIIPISKDPFFGLHTAHHVQHSSYSVLGYISMNCANLGEVLTQMPLYEKIVGAMGSSSRIVSTDATCLRFDCHFADPLVRRHVTENVLASWDRFSRTYLHLMGYPLRIYFEHSAPDEDALLDIYRNTFHCDVYFDQEYSGTWIRNADLSIPIEQANEQLLQTLLEHASEELRQLDEGRSLGEKVKNMLRLMISEKLPSKERLAEELGMSSRTLQRKLNEEGAHYQEILDELRLEMAIQFFSHKELSLDEIARKLGYLETRSFYRGFKQWTGKTVGAYRKETLPGP